MAGVLVERMFLNGTTGSRTEEMKNQLVIDRKNENSDRMLLCMLLCMVMNIDLPSSVVIAEHIFRQKHPRLKNALVQIDDVRNGLLLFKPIKSAFNDLDMAFTVDQRDQFTLKVFNPTIKAQMLVDRLTKQQWDALGGGSVPTNWKKSTTPIYAPKAPDFNLLTTFGELDGKTLQFPSRSTLRPFRRCLYFQAQLARTNALTHGWVSEDYHFDDFSLRGFAVWEKVKLLLK